MNKLRCMAEQIKKDLTNNMDALSQIIQAISVVVGVIATVFILPWWGGIVFTAMKAWFGTIMLWQAVFIGVPLMFIPVFVFLICLYLFRVYRRCCKG